MSKIERGSMTQTDDKGKVTRAPRDAASGEAQNFRWWKVDEATRANAIAGTVKFMQQRQSGHVDTLVECTRDYGSTGNVGLFGRGTTRSANANTSPMNQRVSFNLGASIVDTLVSKIAKNKVIPSYITNGGIWKVQKQAKQLTKFAQGLCYEQNIHKKVVNQFRDSAVWGDGVVHIFDKNNKVAVERCLPHEFVVDTVECQTRPPQQLHWVKIVDRDIALDMFPELEDYINVVSPATNQEVGGQTAVDLITITESWHLKSGPDADDGLHVISIGDGSISDEYDYDYFPFVFLPYAKDLLGFWGQGAIQRLSKLQHEINRNMALVQASLHRNATFKVLLETGSKVVSQHLNNDVGSIIHYTGTAPQYIIPPAVQPEIYQWIDGLIAKGYKQEGVSSLSASGEHPLGVDSGKALRTIVDVEDDRFLSIQQDIEDCVLEIVRQAIDRVKEIHARTKTYEVVFPNTKFIETVDWNDIDLEEEEYVLQAFPTSELADDLTGRLSEIQELAQAGMISPRTARRMMGMPDIEMNENLSNAAEDLLHKIMEDMLDDGIYRDFEPTFMDMTLAKQLVLEYHNYADYMNCPVDKLNLLERFNSSIQDEVDRQAAIAAQQQAQAQAQEAASQASPQANPTATPTSNLLPNQPTGGQ